MSVKLRKKNLADGKKGLYLDIYHNGQRHYDFLKLYLEKGTSSRIIAANRETLELAETIKTQKQNEINHAEHGLIPSFKRNADFVAYFKKLGESKSRSSKVWRNVLNYLEVFTGGRVVFKNIDELWLEKWQRFLLEKVSRNTAVDYYSLTKAALNQAVRDRIIQDNPCRRVQNIKRQDTERNFLTFAEIKQLSETLPKAENSKEVARMFLFGCFTGLSLGNLETLTYKQIEDDTVKFFRTKTKTWHHVPLNETALSLIDVTYDCDPNGRIFNTPSRRYSQTLVGKWGKQAGIKKHVHMHLSRHTFATLNLSSGADLYTVSKLIGHKKLDTTQIYAKVIDSAKRKAVDALPQLEL